MTDPARTLVHTAVVVLVVTAVTAGTTGAAAGLSAATTVAPGPDAAARAGCGGPTPALLLVGLESGARLLSVPVSNGTPVALSYVHSVEKTRVVDAYRVAGDRLVNSRMEFESYGAGLPSTAAVNRTADGSFVFDPAGSYRDLWVKPGRVAGHVLRVGDRRFDLVALSDASTVRLSVATVGGRCRGGGP